MSNALMPPELQMNLPIRALDASDAARIERHLLRLSPGDRSLRFAAGVVSDDTVREYVARIRFGNDALLGIDDDRGELVAFAHGCVYSVGKRARVEVAFSVDAQRRRLGCGAALMARMRAFAESIGAHCVVGMCLARNLPMRAIFARAGMTMTRDGDEVHATCQLSRRDAAPLETPLAA
jgi:GNAT superfamily N-acetyltransferase